MARKPENPCDTPAVIATGSARARPVRMPLAAKVVSGSQGFVEAQSLLETSPFIAVVPEVFRILQEQPTSAFEDVFLEILGSFPVQITPQPGQFLVHELDHVEVIEHDGCSG